MCMYDQYTFTSSTPETSVKHFMLLQPYRGHHPPLQLWGSSIISRNDIGFDGHFWCDACFVTLWSRWLTSSSSWSPSLLAIGLGSLVARESPPVCSQWCSVRGRILVTRWPFAGVGKREQKGMCVRVPRADVKARADVHV